MKAKYNKDFSAICIILSVIMIICTGEKNAALLNSLHDRKAQLFTASGRELVKISQSLSKSLISARVSLMLNYIYNNSIALETRVPLCL